ncbi:MAG: aspartyl/asparaginyl beta-hydroxylase domain-containing protein [Proteobacteria bacterium]|nr:aspartyl/asparaginyl beta-hydroxylase domain-containing protein [Pseudomonadota bacterium]
MAFFSSFSFKILFFFSYISSISYTHLRGKVKLNFLRQLTDHSSLMAPINAIMYLFSAVPRTAYLDLQTFPELKILRDNWEIIREEALNLYNEGYISSSDKHDDIGFNSFFRRGWKRFYLKWYQDPLSSAENLCPKTIELIKQVPNINAAMFTLLPKGSFLFPHRDPYAGSLRYHLGLVTPNSEECRIFVDGQSYYWQDGKDVLFDETFVHYAENKTETDRIILFCDVKRPLTNRLANAFNDFFSRTVMKAASSKNLPTEKVGVINRLFKYLYQIRLVGKNLKKYNRKLYYFVKYSLFIATLLYFIF